MHRYDRSDMHDVPAAWYDDPEDPSQYRYWDGSQWTDHRAPKYAGTESKARNGVVQATWRLGTQAIGPLIGIGALYILALLPALIVVTVGTVQSLEPGLGVIIDELTSDTWNPGSDPGDEAFLDSIRWSPTTFFWVTGAAALLYAFPVSILAHSTAIILMANRHRGGSMQFAEAWSIGLNRFARHAAISMLWVVCSLAVVGVLAGLWILAIFATPFVFVVAVPLTVAVVVYLYPFVWLALISLYTGPVDRPPWRSITALVKPRWATVARPVLVINVVIVGIGLASSLLSLVPILGLVASLASSVAQWIAQHGSGIVIWDQIGGEFDPKISDPK